MNKLFARSTALAGLAALALCGCAKKDDGTISTARRVTKMTSRPGNFSFANAYAAIEHSRSCAATVTIDEMTVLIYIRPKGTSRNTSR